MGQIVVGQQQHIHKENGLVIMLLVLVNILLLVMLVQTVQTVQDPSLVAVVGLPLILRVLVVQLKLERFLVSKSKMLLHVVVFIVLKERGVLAQLVHVFLNPLPEFLAVARYLDV
jgi:hypothetical protein